MKRNTSGLSIKGFTLIEVMVALLIVSVSISALLVQIMGNVDNVGYLRDKTIAHWVALNQLELVYLENQKSNQVIDSERSGSEEMAGRTWYWQIKFEEIANEEFQKLAISVRAEEDDESSLVRVMGVIDPFHKN